MDTSHAPDDEADEVACAAVATRCPLNPLVAGETTHAEDPAHPTRAAKAVKTLRRGAIVEGYKSAKRPGGDAGVLRVATMERMHAWLMLRVRAEELRTGRGATGLIWRRYYEVARGTLTRKIFIHKFNLPSVSTPNTGYIKVEPQQSNNRNSCAPLALLLAPRVGGRERPNVHAPCWLSGKEACCYFCG